MWSVPNCLGSGIKRVLRAFNEYQLKAPVFEDFQHGFRVTVWRTPQKTPQKDGVKTKILDFLMENPYLSQREVAEKLGISFDTAKEHFSKLKKENRIKRMGGRKNGFWNVL
jgi:ATP-dependent DNA helicase RecG